MAQWLATVANRAKAAVEKGKEVVGNAAKKMEAEIQKAQVQLAAEQQRVKSESEYSKKVQKGEGAELPWETDDEELGILTQDVMERVLSLSLTEQNFSEVPPKLELLPFVFTDNVATAMCLLKLDANLARMHAKLSPKLKEEVFWRHYFFRTRYIRLKLGMENIDSSSPLAPLMELAEDDVLYKPTFVPPPKPVKPAKPAVVAGGVSGAKAGGVGICPSSSSSKLQQQEDPLDDLDLDDEEVDEEAKKEMDQRRKEEKALAAEVEAVLDNDELDLGDLDEDFDDGDFDDLGDLDLDDVDEDGKGGGAEDLGDDDDDELESAIRAQLKK